MSLRHLLPLAASFLLACASDPAGGPDPSGPGGSEATATGAGASGSGGGGSVTGAGGGGQGGDPLGASSATTASGPTTGTGSQSAGVDPSNGMGGAIGPAQEGASPLGAVIRIPAGYDPATFASPVIWLFNETIPQWSAIADPDRAVLVDLKEYNDVDAIVAKLNETTTILEAEYNVDRARYYWAGWSAGGNIAVILAAGNQQLLAGTLVFPGTGGNYAKQGMEQNQGHKIRLYYACGDQDPNYQWQAVEYEADAWASIGYTTRFDKAAGAPHYIDEALYGVRAAGWGWIKDFNLEN